MADPMAAPGGSSSSRKAAALVVISTVKVIPKDREDLTEQLVIDFAVKLGLEFGEHFGTRTEPGTYIKMASASADGTFACPITPCISRTVAGQYCQSFAHGRQSRDGWTR